MWTSPQTVLLLLTSSPLPKVVQMVAAQAPLAATEQPHFQEAKPCLQLHHLLQQTQATLAAAEVLLHLALLVLAALGGTAPVVSQVRDLKWASLAFSFIAELAEASARIVLVDMVCAEPTEQFGQGWATTHRVVP